MCYMGTFSVFSVEISQYFLTAYFSVSFLRPGARTRTPQKTDRKRVGFIAYSISKTIFFRLDTSGKTVWITKIRRVKPSGYARYVRGLVMSSVDTAARSEEGRAVAAAGALRKPSRFCFLVPGIYIYICICFSPPSFCFVYRGST